MGTSNDWADEERVKLEKDRHAVEVSAKDVDTGAALMYGEHEELDPAEALRVRKKIDYHILPLMCILYWIQYMDKTTLGSSAILGIIKAAHLTTNQYNWLGTIFYLSYLAFEFPQNLALQRFPVAKWMSINIFIWAVALTSHAACTSFGGLFAVRLILGMCEGSITAGFMIVSSMFYTRKEQTLRVGYWFLMNGTGILHSPACFIQLTSLIAQIISGFISFGTLHIKTSKFEPWQWLMVITGILTLFTSVSFWFFFPDSPTNAWFLTPAERVVAVMRLKENQTGVENKLFKKSHNQRQIIVSSFGFTTLQTTLLGCVDGVIEIVTIWTGVTISARLNSRAWVAFFYFIPNVLGTILVNVLPWSDKVGLLFSVWVGEVGTPGFVLSLSWVSSVTAGHTKRVTTNAIVLGAYCIGNAAGPFMWKAQYKPRNHVPWTVIGICYACCMVLVLTIRFLLIAENKRRDAEPARDGGYDDVYVERPASDGSGRMEKVKVDKHLKREMKFRWFAAQVEMVETKVFKVKRPQWTGHYGATGEPKVVKRTWGAVATDI
ncbi:major facilitator superfamily domain-containing protein [Mycena leptocephala]|nr:major facilitator superfamily domain-containing protein [Mycena leptocephala]